jgi:hypothetical protein
MNTVAFGHAIGTVDFNAGMRFSKAPKQESLVTAFGTGSLRFGCEERLPTGSQDDLAS